MNLLKKSAIVAGWSKTPAFYTPVYTKELLSPLENPGHFIEHASYKQIYLSVEDEKMTGVAYTREGSVYFITDGLPIIAHIKKEGMVPLVYHSPHLRWFKTKSILQKHIKKQTVGA